VARTPDLQLHALWRARIKHLEGDQPSADVRKNLIALARQVHERLGEWIEPRIAIASASRPASFAWNGPVIFDVDRFLH
jgi:hypothetical protein